MTLMLKNLNRLFYRTPKEISSQIQPSRSKGDVGHGWTDWRMIKDWKKRNEVARQSKTRLRLNVLRKCNLLPPELRELATKEIQSLPRYGCINQIVYRCSITSRARGTVIPFRLSRIMFKHLADYNYLSGMQRAMW